MENDNIGVGMGTKQMIEFCETCLSHPMDKLFINKYVPRTGVFTCTKNSMIRD